MNSAVLNALAFASRAHAHQRRKADDSPYINHLIEIVDLLTNVGGITDETTLVASVLHDVLEDTAVTESDLSETFGPWVTDVVVALTDDISLPLGERRHVQLESIKGALTAVKLIMLAEHCSNIALIPEFWSEQRVKDYRAWSQQVAWKCSGVSSALTDEYATRFYKEDVPYIMPRPMF